MVLRAFLLFTLTKSPWRQWPLISEVLWLIPFYRQLFFFSQTSRKCLTDTGFEPKLPKVSVLALYLGLEIGFISVNCCVGANFGQRTPICLGLPSSNASHFAQRLKCWKLIKKKKTKISNSNKILKLYYPDRDLLKCKRPNSALEPIWTPL